MNLPHRLGLLSFILLTAAPLANAQFIYEVVKAKSFIQTSASGATLDPNDGTSFYYLSPIATTVTPSGLPTLTPPFVAGADGYQINPNFATLAELDAAFPDGNYVIKAPSIGTVTVPLSGSLYPATPAVTGGAGTWLPGGILALDPTLSNTLNLSNFTGYSTAGKAGAIQIQLLDLDGNEAGELAELVSTETLFTGGKILASPLATFTIGTGTITAGHLYVLSINYYTFTDVDETSIPAYDIFALYDAATYVYIVAQTATTASAPVPSITTQPASQTATVGSTFTFNIPGSFPAASASGAGVSWIFIDSNGNVGVPSKDTVNNTATNAQLVINNVAATDAGTYYIEVVSPAGILESQGATLTVKPPSIPVISTAPVSQTINAGSTLVLTVVATGATSYQWSFNGVPLTDSPGGTPSDIITGSTGPQLVVTNVSGAGTYSVIATNSTGSSPSSSATITVVKSATPGTVTSISSRAFVGSGDNILIGGFYIVGSTSRSVLIQALGPALAPPPFNVSGTLQNPILSVHQYQSGKDVVLYTNTGWGSSQVLLNAAAAVYASPTLQPGTADSELLLTLPPGGYTAEVQGANGGTGVALCGIYELP